MLIHGFCAIFLSLYVVQTAQLPTQGIPQGQCKKSTTGSTRAGDFLLLLDSVGVLVVCFSNAFPLALHLYQQQVVGEVDAPAPFLL